MLDVLVGLAGNAASPASPGSADCGTVSAMIRSGGSSRARSSLAEAPTSGLTPSLVSARAPPLPTAAVVVPARARTPASVPARAVVAFAVPAVPAVPADPPASAASAQSAGQRHPALPSPECSAARTRAPAPSVSQPSAGQVRSPTVRVTRLTGRPAPA